MADLSTSIGSLKLKNPVLTASGTFGYGEEYSPYVDLNRLGAVVVKGISLEPRKGNPPPRAVGPEFNAEARRLAGLDDEFIRRLQAFEEP